MVSFMEIVEMLLDERELSFLQQNVLTKAALGDTVVLCFKQRSLPKGGNCVVKREWDAMTFDLSLLVSANCLADCLEL